MQANISSPAPSDSAELDPASGEAACRAVLVELMAIGMALARRVGTDADMPVPESVAAFERVSRAVRRTVRMVRWLDEAPARRMPGRVGARRQVLRAVEDRIDRVAEAGEADGLHAELLERLDAAELEEELAGRPAAEVIGEICRDLGLDRWPETHPSLRRRPADVAALHRRAEAAVGSTRAVVAPALALARWEQPDTDEPDGLEALPDTALHAMDWRRRQS